VTSVELEHIGTFSNELWRVRLGYDRAEAEAPASVVLKHSSPGRVDRVAEGFANEIRFYRDVSHRAGVRTPRFHFGGDDGETQCSLLLLEDVGDIAPIHFGRGASAEHARLALEALARLHARWWEKVADLDWIPHLENPDVRASFAEAYDRGWPATRDLHGSLAPSFVPIGDALVGRVPDALAPLGAPATLLHGDAHFENLPLFGPKGAEEGVLFLDWAGTRRGLASFDVAVFGVMSFPVEIRRRVEEGLVAAHADSVRAAGVQWSDPWDDYRRGVLRRAVRIVEIAPGWRRNAVAESALRMVVERCATAAADLRVDDLLG
jgi:hypothetical protein